MNPLKIREQNQKKKRFFSFLLISTIMLSVFQFWPQPESSAQGHLPIIQRVMKDTMALHKAKITYEETLKQFDSTLAVTVDQNKTSKKKD